MTRIIIAAALIVILLAGTAGCGSSPPEADFTASPVTGYAPEEVQFTDLSQGNVTGWAWDFNDDGVIDSGLQNPGYILRNPGNYTVSLTVTGSDGNDTEVKTEYLKIIPCPNFADFVADPPEMSGVHPIQFTDLSSMVSGNITGWAWDFSSDGTVDSTEQNPIYTYRTNGLYTVTLTVTTDECTDTVTKHEYIRITGCSR
ncbi:PKD domain-containing protein [Chloroflexota bacterium]